MNGLDFLAVACGGALGAVSRSLVYLAVAESGNARLFALPTFLVNVIGSFIIGMAYVALTERLQLSPLWRQGLMVGFLGAFTTFSTFSLDLLRQLQEGNWLEAIGYCLASVLVCLLAVWAGYALMQRLLI